MILLKLHLYFDLSFHDITREPIVQTVSTNDFKMIFFYDLCFCIHNKFYVSIFISIMKFMKKNIS